MAFRNGTEAHSLHLLLSERGYRLENGQQLVEGTRVEVIVRETPAKRTLRDRVMKLAGTVDDLSADSIGKRR